jgi:hypothetical protein
MSIASSSYSMTATSRSITAHGRLPRRVSRLSPRALIVRYDRVTIRPSRARRISGLELYIKFATIRLRLIRMGKIDEFAGSVNETLAGLEDDFGGLSIKAQALKEKGAEVAQRWKQHFADQANALAAAEAAINKVSNAPLPVRTSSVQQGVSAQSVAEVKKVEPFPGIRASGNA